jgi:nifR3 family TIM-barrel protein
VRRVVVCLRPLLPMNALRLGAIAADPPVVLAPMAGVTNRAFRRLCRRYGAAILVSEMVNARSIIEGSRRSAELRAFDADETTRSIQLYGADPATIAAAVRVVVGEGAQHVDLNFGCPVRKVTRHGGGAALAARPRLVAAIVEHAVGAAGTDAVVTVKMRVGLDESRPTFVAAARAATDAGAAAVALHARTAEQMYSGTARWDTIAQLVCEIDVPVLGNGDIFSGADAQAMMRTTGCAGVVIGRGCLGRPWFFAELTAALRGDPLPPLPRLGEVAATLREHAELLAEQAAPQYAILAIRKHVGWYLTGYPTGPAVRRGLTTASDLAGFFAHLDTLDPDLAADAAVVRRPRGTTRGPYPVTLPRGWLDAEASAPPTHPDAALATSGG